MTTIIAAFCFSIPYINIPKGYFVRTKGCFIRMKRRFILTKQCFIKK
ncbi:MAG: hypothetical protein LBL74_06390 [Bacteroidales bacterium]|nr:hypothetical protein [Bacteroidales bacterium]